MGVLLAMFLALAGPQDPAPAGTAAIEGVVTRAGTSQPIANARVTIHSRVDEKSFAATTDGNGRFELSNLPAGRFEVLVQAEGYLDDPPPPIGVQLGLNDGQRLRRDVALTATSSIDVRVVDDDRKPVAKTNVELLRQSTGFSGRTSWQEVASGVTDDEGTYRFDRLPAGEFYVRATSDYSAETPATFFPGVLDPRAAAGISVRTGDSKRAEFALAKGKTFSIAGTIKNADGSPLQGARLYVWPQDLTIPADEKFAQGVPVNEKLELKGLLPGIYDLFVASFPGFRQRPMGLDGARAARSFVQIRDEDVRDLSLSLETGGAVSGHIKFKGTNTPLPGLQLLLTERTPLTPDKVARGGVLESPDSIRFSGMTPGVYDVLMMPSGNAYVADVRAFGRSIVDEGLTVGPNAVDSLEILIDVDGGAVRGSVSGAKKSSTLVVLAPRSLPRRPGAFLAATGLDDPSGSFVFSGVPPGSYSLFAFELATLDEVLPILSPNFLPQYLSKSVPVTVEKGAAVSPPPLTLISR